MAAMRAQELMHINNMQAKQQKVYIGISKRHYAGASSKFPHVDVRRSKVESTPPNLVPDPPVSSLVTVNGAKKMMHAERNAGRAVEHCKLVSGERVVSCEWCVGRRQPCDHAHCAASGFRRRPFQV